MSDEFGHYGWKPSILAYVMANCFLENDPAGFCINPLEHITNISYLRHSTGKAGLGRILSWGERLRIAVEAAQGLAGNATQTIISILLPKFGLYSFSSSADFWA